MRMKIWIVEDEAPQRMLLCDLVRQACGRHGVKADIVALGSGETLANTYQSGADLLLLDIDMPGINGMDAAHIIRRKDERVQIAFCTNLVSRALDGYAVAAMDFLVKPITAARIDELLDKVFHRLSVTAPVTLTLHTQDATTVVRTNEILYAETYGRKLRLHTMQDTLDLRMTMAALESQLPSGNFFRIHNAYLVSLAHVSRISGFEVSVGDDTLPVSRHKKREFLQALTDYIGDQL